MGFLPPQLAILKVRWIKRKVEPLTRVSTFLFPVEYWELNWELGTDSLLIFQQLRHLETANMPSPVFNNIDFSIVSIALKINGGEKNLEPHFCVLCPSAISAMNTTASSPSNHGSPTTSVPPPGLLP